MDVLTADDFYHTVQYENRPDEYFHRILCCLVFFRSDLDLVGRAVGALRCPVKGPSDTDLSGDGGQWYRSYVAELSIRAIPGNPGFGV